MLVIGMNSESHGGSVPSVLQILPEPACSCISTEFVLFVHGQYSDNQLKQVKALNAKLDSLPMVGIHSAINSEASNVAHKILSLIGQVKGDNPRLLARNLCMKAQAYNNLGCIAAEGASTESVKEAVVHVEKELELREASGNAVGVDNAKFSIAVAKSIGNEEELLKASQGVHVLYANVYCKEHI